MPLHQQQQEKYVRDRRCCPLRNEGWFSNIKNTDMGGLYRIMTQEVNPAMNTHVSRKIVVLKTPVSDLIDMNTNVPAQPKNTYNRNIPAVQIVTQHAVYYK